MSFKVLYAGTEGGSQLPVIDVTHPAFAVAATEAELEAMAQRFIQEQQERREISAALREALSQSILGRALMAASGTYLPGMSTYLMKLGPEQFGAEAHPIDRSIAASFPAFTTRLRLQDMARLLADGLVPAIAAWPQRPVCLINIAGGPGADSWNALLHIQREHPGLLQGRSIVVAVLDLDERGPAFGERAVASLSASGAPLAGLAIDFRYIRYDWAETEWLSRTLADLGAPDAACAISSEGGLFEYGSDAEMVANLEKLHTGTAPDAVVVGSVTREGEAVRANHAGTGVAARPHTIEAFRSLAGEAGWLVEQVIKRPFSFNVCLTRR